MKKYILLLVFISAGGLRMSAQDAVQQPHFYFTTGLGFATWNSFNDWSRNDKAELNNVTENILSVLIIGSIDSSLVETSHAKQSSSFEAGVGFFLGKKARLEFKYAYQQGRYSYYTYNGNPYFEHVSFNVASVGILYDWLELDELTFYSGLHLGGCFLYRQGDNPEVFANGPAFLPAMQIDGWGLRAGTKKLKGYVCGGFGHYGVFRAGATYDF